MSKSYIPYLQHILEECRYVRSVVPDDARMYEFLSDETLKRAVTRSLEIIGEATKKNPCRCEISLEHHFVASDGRYARQAHSRLYGHQLLDCMGCGQKYHSCLDPAD